MQLNVASPAGGAGAETIEVSDETFSREFNEDLVHQVVQQEQNRWDQVRQGDDQQSPVSVVQAVIRFLLVVPQL